jgi:hypothetical protein
MPKYYTSNEDVACVFTVLTFYSKAVITVLLIILVYREGDCSAFMLVYWDR